MTSIDVSNYNVFGLVGILIVVAIVVNAVLKSKNVGETIKDNSNSLNELDIKNGIKSGFLSILKILVAIILFLILCGVLAILTDYH